jgi:nitroreductase
MNANMRTDDLNQKNRYLDQIIAERRTHRKFSAESPTEDDVKGIIHAGLQAPFAAAAVGNSRDYFRRFFVMERGSQSLETVKTLALAQVTRMAEGLEKEMTKNPPLREKAGLFAKRLAMFQKMGIVPGIGTAPCFIVVAERRGFPPVELQSLAHCMENMWLKATALGLGFQLVSLTSQFAENPDFCAVLGVTPGVWDFMGCAIGHPADELPPSTRPPVDDVTRWLE